MAAMQLKQAVHTQLVVKVEFKQPKAMLRHILVITQALVISSIHLSIHTLLHMAHN